MAIPCTQDGQLGPFRFPIDKFLSLGGDAYLLHKHPHFDATSLRDFARRSDTPTHLFINRKALPSNEERLVAHPCGRPTAFQSRGHNKI